ARYLGRTSSPLRSDLGFRYTQVPEALAFDRMRRHVLRSRRLLCRRLRYPQPRSRGGGISVDEGGNDQARVDDQRGENFVEKCPTGTLRLPRLLVRRALV